MPDRENGSKEASRSPSNHPSEVDPATSFGKFTAGLFQHLEQWLPTDPALQAKSRIIDELLELIAGQIPCDLVEINLFDESSGFFLPHRWSSKKSKKYLKNTAVERYALGQGYTGWIAEHQATLLIPDTGKENDLVPVTGLDKFPFKSYIGSPLRWNEQLMGTLEIAHTSPGIYSETDTPAVEFIAGHISTTLHIYRLQHGLGHWRAHQEASNAIQALSDYLDDYESLWERLSYALADAFEASLLGIFLNDGGNEQLITPNLLVKQGADWNRMDVRLSAPQGSDLSALWLLQEYWLSNQVDEASLARLNLTPGMKLETIVKLLITPLFAGGERFGILLVGRSQEQHDFHDEEVESLQALCRQMGTMLLSSQRIGQRSGHLTAAAEADAASALEEAEEAISPERMSELLRLSAELTTNLDLDRSLRRVLELCKDLMMADRAVFITGSPGDLTIREVIPEFDPQMTGQAQEMEQAARSIGEWVISRRQSLLISDIGKDERWSVEIMNSLCAVPCISEDDVSGVLLFLAESKDAFGPEDLQIAQIVARQMAGAMNHSYLYGVIREQADRLGLMLRSQQIETSQSNAILESIADGVIVTDAKHKVILYNDAAERILNLPAPQIVGKEIFDHIGIFGPDTLAWGETIRAWETTPPEQHRLMIPERMSLDDGRIISILPAPVVLAGDFQGTVSIFRDISREVEVDRLKSEFVATVSHELRTPMTSIKGFVDLMLMGAAGNLNDEQRHFLDIVRTNTNRLQILVNDLLDISRIEAGKASLIFQEIDVHQLFGEMEQYIKHRCQEESKSMQFTYQDARGLPPIWGDLERVRQILANIVENSFDYTPEAGLIQMHARQVNSHIEIEIADNGMGISLEEQERIFERFYRGEQALIMGVSGTGLGLAIVLNLVEMHQGRIWVTSEGAGKGSTFTVSLPIAPDTEA